MSDSTCVTYGSDDLPARHVAAALAGAGFEVSPFRRSERSLLDTFDGRLHAAGMRLEVAKEAASFRLTLSDGGPAPAVMTVAQAPATVDDLPPGPLRARLAPIVEMRALRPQVTVSSMHATALRRNEADKAVAAVDVHDELVLGSGQRLSAPWSAEVVPFEGYEKAARQADALLKSIGLRALGGDLFQVAAKEAGVDLRGFQDRAWVPLDPSEPAAGGYRRVLANLAATAGANWQGTVDDVDSEFLHDFRIAVRRSRSILSHAKGVLPSVGRRHFGAELRWLGAATSPLRDADVYLIEWPGYVAPLDAESSAALEPLLAHIQARRAAEHVTLVDELHSPRYQRFITEWAAWLEDSEAPAKGRRPLGTVVAARILDAQDQVLARGRPITPATPAEELHELRKHAKRLRYLLECFGGLLPASRRKPFVQRLKALQDNLGEHQDTEVHTAQLKTMSQELHEAGVSAGTLIAMGRLTEIFEHRRLQAREDFAARFTAYDTKQTARVLDELIETARV